MKFPNYVKIGWWVALVGLLTWFLLQRWPALVAGSAVPFDALAVVVWIALLLAPLFAEISLFGVTFKQQIEDLKEHVGDEVGKLRNEIRNSIDLRTTVSPQFNFVPPPPDWQLPQLEERIRAIVAETRATSRTVPESPVSPDLGVSSDVSFLFGIRYAIEQELRRIARNRQLIEGDRRHLPVTQLLRLLSNAELVDSRLASAVREVYAVCSPAIHGEPVTRVQLAFARDVGPELVAALREIQ